MENLQYPIGKFEAKPAYSSDEINAFLNTLREFPAVLANEIKDINASQLATPYRPGGWTALQVIHHLSDSHSQMLTRLKWTLTEDTPQIKAYHEDRWALLADYSLPFEISVKQIDVIHQKIVAIFESLSAEDLEKQYYHPDAKAHYSLKKVMALYAWHCNHHLAHLKICKA